MKITLKRLYVQLFHARILLKNGTQPIFVSSGNTVEFHFYLCRRRAAEWRFLWNILQMRERKSVLR